VHSFLPLPSHFAIRVDAEVGRFDYLCRGNHSVMLC